MADRIELEGQIARLVIGQTPVSELHVQDLDQWIVAGLSNGLFQGEEPFYVLRAGDRIWVVPFFTEGILDLLRLAAPRLEGRAMIYRVQRERMPLAWRRRLGDMPPLFPLPRLSAHAASTMPRWQEEGPFTLSEVPELREELNDG